MRGQVSGSGLGVGSPDPTPRFGLTLLVAFALSLALATAAPPSPGPEALDYAFRFASALDADPKDKDKAQYAVVMEYAALGFLDEAVRRAEEIGGYRRHVARADLAARLAHAGRTADATALVAKVEADRRSIQGWEGPRVAAHLAQAYAALGSVEPSASIARDLANNDPRQYAGRAVAVEAIALGAKGEYEQAIGKLGTLDADTDIEAAWWRTTGYLDLSRAAGLEESQRQAAIAAARRSADGLPEWKRVEALVEIAERQRELGSRDGAVEALGSAEAIVVALGSTDESRPRLLSAVARAWADLGQTERARRLLAEADTGIHRAPDIDRPALWAVVGAGWHAAGDASDARRSFAQAFDAASTLQNARPRALAVVSICCSLAREGMPLDQATRERLDALLAGLGAPW